MSKIILGSVVTAVMCGLFILGGSGCENPYAVAKPDLGNKYIYSYRLVEANAGDMAWSDKILHIRFQITETEILFTLNNLSEQHFKIIWDECSLVLAGRGKRIIHNGVKLIDRNAPQLPSIVPPKTSMEDLVVPVENIRWSEGYGYMPGEWDTADLIPTHDLNEARFRETIMSSKGQIGAKLYLAVDTGSTKTIYEFTFEIADVIPEKKQ